MPSPLTSRSHFALGALLLACSSGSGVSQQPAASTCATPCEGGLVCVAGACQVPGSSGGTGATPVTSAGTSATGSSGGTSTSMAGTTSGGAGGSAGTTGTGAAGTTVGGGGAPLGSSGATATAGSDPGTAGAGAGGMGSGGSGGSGGSTTQPPQNAWHAAVATQVTDSMMESAYDAWKAAFVVDCGGSHSVDRGGGSVVSEGIAYGMLLAANMDDRALLDGLWTFYNDHLDANGLMNWSMDVCAPPGDNTAGAATDAELDAAMALLQAHAAWPDGGYLAEAEGLAAKILEFETDDCDGRLTLRPGDNWGGCRGMENRINPSYFAPGYYRAFAYHFPTQAEQWNALLEGTYELYPGYAGAASDGPYPDWSNADGSANGSGYYYDAARVPWRIATDYAWSGDPRAVTELERVQAFIDGKGGIPVSGLDNNSAFSGAFALAGVTDSAKLDGYVSAWMSAGGDDNPYFQATLRVIYLLLAGGRFPSTF